MNGVKKQYTLKQEQLWIEESKKSTSAFKPLYEQYYEPIFRFVYQRMNQIDDAQEVTSLVFYKALTKINSYEFRGFPFSSWLYRIAVSEMNQWFRDNGKQRTVNVESSGVQLLIEENEVSSYEGDMDQMVQWLRVLKEDDLLLIEMKYFEKKSYKEIGEILNLTETNAKVKTFRVLKKLKNLANKS